MSINELRSLTEEEANTPMLPEKFEIRIMDKDQGDIKMEWDEDRPEEVAAAREAFDKAKKKGMLFYRMKRNGTAGEVIREFDPSAERIVGMPMVQGG